MDALPGPPVTTIRRLRFALFGSGLLLSAWMVLRSQVSEDQFEFLLPGWTLLTEGVLLPFGNLMSGGGLYPGPLVGLLGGLPLFVWEDYRAVVALLLLTHVVAYLVMNRGLREIVGERGLLLFCALYWLNPWRLNYSAHLWNSNWMFLVGAVYFLCAYRQRREPRFLVSFTHVLVVGLAFEVHASAVTLVIATCVLLLRGRIKMHWGGALAGAAVVLLTVLPYLQARAEFAEISPLQYGFFGRGLVLVYPLVRGIGYWFRTSSFMLGRQIPAFDFSGSLGAEADAILGPLADGTLAALGLLTIVPVALANFWLWKRRGMETTLTERDAARRWLGSFLRLSLVGAAITYAISPTTIMSWQTFAVMPVSVLPLTLWLERSWRAGGRFAWWYVRAVAIAGLLIGLAIALGAPMYRSGGRHVVELVLKNPHPLVERLGIAENGTVRIDPDEGIATDILESATRNRRP